MQAPLPTPLMELLKKWYQTPLSELGEGLYEGEFPPDSYLLGIEDGKKELATDIFEYLGLINYN